MSIDSHRGLVVIRTMSLDERAIWEELWTGYVDFYNTKISQETKSITWARHRKRSCPLYPQKRTCAVQLGMSAKCQ